MLYWVLMVAIGGSGTKEVIMEILTEKELATFLHLSPWTVRKWRLSGGLPHIQVGRRIFYRVEAVKAWMKTMEEKREVGLQDKTEVAYIV